jgi:hypothetical protein
MTRESLSRIREKARSLNCVHAALHDVEAALADQQAVPQDDAQLVRTG